MKDHCDKFRDQLTRSLTEDLPADQLGPLNEHLDRCPSCQAFAHLLRQDHQRLTDYAQSLDPALHRLQNTTVSLLDQVAQRSVLARRRWMPVAAALAACIFLAVGLTLHLHDDRPAPLDPQARIAQAAWSAHQANRAAQLFAAADLLARQPGGLEYAKQEYAYIAQSFPNTDIASQAQQRLTALSNRSLAQ